MAVNLKGRSFLTLMDFTPEEIRYMLDLAHDLKTKKRSGIQGEMLKGKNIVLLCDKTSTRTRQRSWADFLTVSSIAATSRRWSRILQSTPAYRYGTV